MLRLKARAIIASAIYLLSSFLYAAEPSNNNLFAMGFYNPSIGDDSTFPLLAKSNSQGKTWTYFDISKLPADSKDGYLGTSSCNNDFCVAAGSYYAKSQHGRTPLVAISTNKGDTWSYVATQPRDYDLGVDFQGPITVSCNNQFCAVAAGYLNKKGLWVPLLAISKDKGTTWTYPESIISNLPKETSSRMNSLSSLDCINDFCVAIGRSHDMDSFDEFPLLAAGTHQGTSWHYASLPQGMSELALLQSIKCSETVCAAVGQDFESTPLILTTRDKGITWSYVKDIPADYKKGIFESVHCQGNTCIAVGSFIINHGGKYLPLIALSNDAGLSWTYPKSIVTHLPADLLANPVNALHSVNCHEKTCVAVGDSFERDYDNNDAPLIAVSKDNGINWSYVDVKTIKPNNFRWPYIKNVSYTKNSCVVTGGYGTTQNSRPYFPFLAVSNDDGSTWSLPSTIVSERPKDFYEGLFHKNASSPLSKQMGLLHRWNPKAVASSELLQSKL